MIKYFLIGSIGGLLSGILGIGGGVVFVPLLTYLTKTDLKSKGVEVIAAYKRENQCGCCGVDLTSNEMYEIMNSSFQQCPYCMGVVI